MISFITGKPGGGKGLVVLKELIHELVNGERPIITNLAIKVEPWVRITKHRGKRIVKSEMGLAAYLVREYGQDFDVRKRVHLLPEENTGEFYLWRVNPETHELVKSDCVRDAAGRVTEYDTTNAMRWGGVVYCVDEAWKFYGARSWQDTGKGVLFAGAQHRKLADRWFIVTQNTKQVDTCLRQVAEDFWVCVNHGKKKLGAWRQPEMFQVLVYGEVPTGAGEPMTRKVFKLDKVGIGGCYDTAGGVGVAGGGGADIGERAKGLPVWTILVGIVGLGVLILGAMKAAGWMTKSYMTKLTGHHEAVPGGADQRSTNNTGALVGAVARATASYRPQGHAILSEPLPVPERVWVVGWQRMDGARAFVSLSDGRTVGPGDGLQRLAEDYAIIAGQRYDFRHSRN